MKLYHIFIITCGLYWWFQNQYKLCTRLKFTIKAQLALDVYNYISDCWYCNYFLFHRKDLRRYLQVGHTRYLVTRKWDIRKVVSWKNLFPVRMSTLIQNQIITTCRRYLIFFNDWIFRRRKLWRHADKRRLCHCGGYFQQERTPGGWALQQKSGRAIPIFGAKTETSRYLTSLFS